MGPDHSVIESLGIALLEPCFWRETINMATSTVQPTLWERTKNVSTAAYTKAKPGFDKVYNVSRGCSADIIGVLTDYR